jgi:hypothetical protein
MTVLPFSDFLELLRAKGFGVGLHEHIALGKLLSRWDSTDRDELRGAIAALVARRDEEVAAILRLFDEIYPPEIRRDDERPPEPDLHARKYRLVQLAKTPAFWATTAGALALAVSIGIASWYYSTIEWPEPPAAAFLPRSLPMPQMPRPDDPAPIQPLPEALIEYQAEPAAALPPPPARVKWRALSGLSAAALGVTLVALWGTRMRRSARRWTIDAWHQALSALPGPHHSSLILKDLVVRLPRADLEEAATLLGRAFSEEARGRELDVTRSLRETLRAGLRPHLLFKPRRVQETILVLLDHSQFMSAHMRRVEAFIIDLARYGIFMECWYFDGDVAVQARQPFGQPIALDDLARRRQDYPLMIVSNGLGVAATLQRPDLWLDALKTWTRRVWLTPVTDESLWPLALARLPIEVVGLNRAGLLRAANILARGESERVGVTGRIAAAARPVSLGDVEELKQLASVVPYPSVDLLELLRQRFAPHVPEPAVLHVADAGATHAGAPIQMSDGEIRDHLRQLRLGRAALEADVREYLLEVLHDSEPAAGSVAHLRWQISTAVHETQLAALRGRDTAPVLAKVAALAHSPLWQELRDSIARLPESGRPSDDMRKSAGIKGKGVEPPTFEDPTGRLGVPRFRWIVPGPRELGLSFGVALIVAALAALATPFRAQASHILNAYTLEYAPPQASSLAGELRVRAAAADVAPPTMLQLYRDDQAYGEPFRLDREDGSTAVRIESTGAAYVYQVRAALDTGALAVSNAILAPSVLVVVDAQPWARVTIRSDGNRIRDIRDTTPMAVRLPEGPYTLAFENDVTSQRNERITVTTAGERVFRFVMPGFDPQTLFDQPVQRPALAR